MVKNEININNYSDLSKFYRRLRLYKIIYKNIKLNISDNIKENDKEELLMCEHAFNIKDKYKRLEYVYDSICNYHDKLYISTNICEFDNNGDCLAKRNNKCKVKHNGCCGTCKYLGNNGCTIKCMACKGYFCNYIKKVKKIKGINKQKLFKYFLSHPQKQICMVNFWTPKEYTLKIMMKNNYIYNYISKYSRLRRL